MSKDKTLYLRWLRAAYLYYISPGLDSGMSDAEWDHHAREFFKRRDELPASEFPALHDERWSGGSLFFLRAEDYPEEVKT